MLLKEQLHSNNPIQSATFNVVVVYMYGIPFQKRERNNRAQKVERERESIVDNIV
jgi:hypothetical protein